MGTPMNKATLDHRSQQLNPQDPLGKAARDNRTDQMNPNNPASKPSDPGNAPKGRDSGNRRP